MPDEINLSSEQEVGLIDETQHIDTLNVHHSDNVNADQGALIYRDTSAGIENIGYALTGLEMSEDIVVKLQPDVRE